MSEGGLTIAQALETIVVQQHQLEILQAQRKAISEQAGCLHKQGITLEESMRLLAKSVWNRMKCEGLFCETLKPDAGGYFEFLCNGKRYRVKPHTAEVVALGPVASIDPELRVAPDGKAHDGPMWPTETGASDQLAAAGQGVDAMDEPGEGNGE